MAIWMVLSTRKIEPTVAFQSVPKVLESTRRVHIGTAVITPQRKRLLSNGTILRQDDRGWLMMSLLRTYLKVANVEYLDPLDCGSRLECLDLHQFSLALYCLLRDCFWLASLRRICATQAVDKAHTIISNHMSIKYLACKVVQLSPLILRPDILLQ
jgi:hypothetical protein